MNIFEYNDYRKFLQAVCEEGKRGMQASLARAAGCQASYFSQVLQGKVHLTEDQAFAIGEYLNQAQDEADYFLLLIRYEKAGTKKLQTFLKNSIEQARQAQSNLSRRVGADQVIYSEEDLGKYLCSWIPSCVHLLTSSSEFQTPEKIGMRLNLPLAKVKETLQLLKKMNLVEHQNNRWSYKGGTFHVTKDSPWQSSMQSARRQLALKSIELNPPESVHFSSLFTIDENEKEEIRKLISQFIQNSHQKIQKSGTEQLCCLCLDLFTVI